jgi:hypothetical protein
MLVSIGSWIAYMTRLNGRTVGFDGAELPPSSRSRPAHRQRERRAQPPLCRSSFGGSGRGPVEHELADQLQHDGRLRLAMRPPSAIICVSPPASSPT